MSQQDRTAHQSPFVSRDELVELTGYRRPSAQAQWLAAKGFTFMVNAAGRPILHRAHVAAKLGGVHTDTEKPWEPNLAALQPRKRSRID